ncbi:hypothetical protein BDP81DRAFT_8888 [Colletotrichum phormii]|uniref:Uncharacterized protein n=1 Tax=Colletotrichum phormii TaxID=359342 RepID=A0AAJ0ENR9_9PEZI|nr:uncharacterized protein BDP81DRAFT_8888 [Colletotrichum phormii]KAK1655728.1 hypothetical protein BDP81DRAFT_8888 [Colletotrichum phormii]
MSHPILDRRSRSPSHHTQHYPTCKSESQRHHQAFLASSHPVIEDQARHRQAHGRKSGG